MMDINQTLSKELFGDSPKANSVAEAAAELRTAYRAYCKNELTTWRLIEECRLLARAVDKAGL